LRSVRLGDDGTAAGAAAGMGASWGRVRTEGSARGAFGIVIATGAAIGGRLNS
jgi:hypothetical protein